MLPRRGIVFFQLDRGEIEDDLDAGAIDLVAAGRDRWKVGGAVTIAILEEATRRKLDWPAESTLADVLEASLGADVRSGTAMQAGNLKFTVLQVRRKKARLFLVERL
ncbi:MAG TPA: hypothetical protein VGD81_21355 [Opitutaceae bacterium]